MNRPFNLNHISTEVRCDILALSKFIQILLIFTDMSFLLIVDNLLIIIRLCLSSVNNKSEAIFFIFFLSYLNLRFVFESILADSFA